MIDIFDNLKEGNSLHEINTIKFKFEKYEIRLLDSPWDDIKKELYIVGVNLSKNSKEVNYKDTVILLSLLELGKLAVESNCQDDFMSTGSQLLLSDKIIEWCNKYGLPYFEDFLRNNYKKNIFGFSIGEFIRQLTVLYNDFNLYYGLTYNDKNFITKNIYASLVDISTEKGLNFIKESFANNVWGNSDISLKLQYNKNTKAFEMIPYTNSFLKIAYFQLGMLMIGDQHEKIKYCSTCGDLFTFTHGNENYCTDCKSNLNRDKQRRHQKKIKESILNEYFSGASIAALSKKYKKTESQIDKWLSEHDKIEL